MFLIADDLRMSSVQRNLPFPRGQSPASPGVRSHSVPPVSDAPPSPRPHAAVPVRPPADGDRRLRGVGAEEELCLAGAAGEAAEPSANSVSHSLRQHPGQGTKRKAVCVCGLRKGRSLTCSLIVMNVIWFRF